MFKKIIAVIESLLLPLYDYSETENGKTLKPFSRLKTFRQFVINVLGALVREDNYGVTSFVRSLHLSGDSYQNLLHMYRSSGINIKVLRHAWTSAVKKVAPLFYSDSELKKDEEERCVTLVIDHKKKAKEGRHMPLVHKMFQESDTQSKAEYIFGHCWGSVGVLIGSLSRFACLPLITNIEDGLSGLTKWKEANIKDETMIIRLYRNAIDCARTLNCNCRFLADRAFLSSAGLKMIDKYNETSEHVLHIITKCRNTVAGYEEPEQSEGRGRPRKKGDPIHLNELFKTRWSEFKQEMMVIYGEKQSVHYYSIDLLWKPGYYKKLRFVLSVTEKNQKHILVTDDLSLTPREVIEAYCFRYRIESMFRTMSQNGTFNYRFWTTAVKKLNRFMKADDPDPLSAIKDKKKRKKILECIQAIEMYVLVCSIATGINQIISLSIKIDSDQLRWQRTPAKKRPSEENVAKYIQKLFNECLRMGVLTDDSQLKQIISGAQRHRSRNIERTL